jgi:hypothetical protein
MPYRVTQVTKNPYLSEMRAMTAALLPQLQFRHHGAGVIQAYIREDVEPEVRVHIWHPDLVIPGIEDSGQIHDHRFELQSCVLLGAVHHDEYHLAPDPEGAWMKYEVVHARTGLTKTPERLVDAADESGMSTYWADIVEGTVSAGETYSFGKRLFHRGWPDQLAITLVTKRAHDDKPAILLAPVGTRPVHAFKDNRPSEALLPFVQMAAEALRREL